jgi:hypothetical protein
MSNKYAIIFFLLILSVSLTGCFLFPPMDKTAEWTVMVYLDGDNNLETYAIQDLNEMEMIGSTTDVNIVVQIDRIPYSVLAGNYQEHADDTSNGNWTTTRRYYITKDLNPDQISSLLIADLGELNMGDPQTLVDFTNWAATNYPAKKYLLVIWNHGGGFRSLNLAKDIAWDDTSGGDKITMPELKDALSTITAQIGKNIDIVGMDACFMAMTEVAYQIKDYADLLVSSEESEPSEGWPYDTILSQLTSDPSLTSTQLATNIVDDYIFAYPPTTNVTQSAIDLSYMDNLAGQLSNLALAIMNDSVTPIDKYIYAANSTQRYSDFDFVDLYDLCNKILIYSNNAKVKNIALNIQQSLDFTVIHSGYNGFMGSGSRGLSIYFPYHYYDNYYNNTNFAQDTWWDEMLHYLGYL